VSITNSILNNIGLKILALITAIVLWIYVAGEQGNTTIKKVVGGRTQEESGKQK